MARWDSVVDRVVTLTAQRSSRLTAVFSPVARNDSAIAGVVLLGPLSAGRRTQRGVTRRFVDVTARTLCGA